MDVERVRGMSTVPRRPRGPEQAVTRHSHRLEDIERRSRPDGRPTDLELVTFSIIDPMEVVRSGVHRSYRGGQVVVVWWDADDVGTGTTTIDLILGGVVIDTLNISAATTEDEFYIGDVRVPPSGRCQIEITAAGMHTGGVVRWILKG